MLKNSCQEYFEPMSDEKRIQDAKLKFFTIKFNPFGRSTCQSHWINLSAHINNITNGRFNAPFSFDGCYYVCTSNFIFWLYRYCQELKGNQYKKLKRNYSFSTCAKPRYRPLCASQNGGLNNDRICSLSIRS